jgi:Spy/CpxP family protein refolding chaperone
MKNYLLLAALTICIGLTAQASVRANPDVPSNTGSQIARELNLTDVQKAQLKPLLRSVHQEVKTIRGDNSLSPDQKMQRLQTLRSQTRAQINQILTPEQQQQLAYLRQQARQARQNQALQAQPPL